MLSTTGNKRILDNDMTREAIQKAVKQLGASVPPRWRVSSISAPSKLARETGVDAVASLKAPDGSSVWLLLEAKSRIEPRDVESLVRQLKTSKRSLNKRNAIPIVIAPFLARRTRDRLQSAGLSYLDLTGNIRVMADRPGFFVTTTGADRNPTPDQGSGRSLKGPKAGRIVRALCDRRKPWRIRELAQATQTDPGYVSRIVRTLQRQDFIKRSGGREAVRDVDWQGLIRRWAEDYSPFDGGVSTTYLAPRGLPSVVDKLRAADFSYAVTGSYAASTLAPITVPRLLTCYVDNATRVENTLGLREAEQGISVILVKPFDRVVYDRTWERDGLRFASPVQVAADLLTSAGRGPSEAEALLAWMRDNEDAWRG